MGSFSFTRADIDTKRANFTESDPFKLLVPIKFGGGYIKDIYYDYGDINEFGGAVYVDAFGKKHPIEGIHDVYGILAYFNDVAVDWDSPDKPKTMLEILEYGNTSLYSNRSAGIDVFHDDDDVFHNDDDSFCDSKSVYLKMVSVSSKYTYETCPGISHSDPNQGFGKFDWDNRDYIKFYDEIKRAQSEYKFKGFTLDELIESGYSMTESNEILKNYEIEK